VSANVGSGECLRRCSACGTDKALDAFYKMGTRLDSRCKDCLKRIRAGQYRKRKKLPVDYAKGRVGKVMVKEIEMKSIELLRKDMEAVELVLENLIYKILSKQINRRAANE
jgi:hypothetical protein